MAYATYSQRQRGRTPRAPARKMGTWKMAYADFLTALMAFFLLMWLINGVTPEDRANMADYFTGQGDETASVTTLPKPDIAALARLISADRQLMAAGTSVTVLATPTDIRINLIDSSSRPLFGTGEDVLTRSGTELTAAAARAIAPFGFPIAIEGHTDAFPSTRGHYSNWELSADRANSARRILTGNGVDESRIRAVTGLAATAPLNPGEPHLSANRRISIVLDITG